MKATHTLIFSFMAILMACKTEPQNNLTQNNLIPKPVSCTATNATFVWNPKTQLYFHPDIKNKVQLQQIIASEIENITNYKPVIGNTPGFFSRNFVQFELLATDTMPYEAYQLTIDKKQITVAAAHEKGLIQGFQTLKQLLYTYPDSIPTGTIIDYPKYAYRGMMLDVARHFFTINDVKRLIDLISLYKINTLHLHLTDDQGWRIEIKSWPKLTHIGGITQVGGGTGGFYTQSEVKEIIAYAGLHGVTIIPEIDIPGHTNAALASYPELNCDNKASKLYTGMRVGFSSLCTNKEITYQFVDDVIGEIATLFPAPYIHIGGDESHATKHTDYVYFINRVLKIAKKYNKSVMGWDEIATADIDSEILTQYWRSEKNVHQTKKKGSQLIFSPSSFMYLDMKYDTTTVLGLHWAGYIDVKKAYTWIPDTLIANISGLDIYGIEAPLWSETTENINDIEYLTFPRLPGYAEIGWSADSVLNWDAYSERLKKHQNIFNTLHIHYFKSNYLKN